MPCAAAAAYTTAKKDAVAKYNLWALYDAAAKAQGADKDASEKAYRAAQEQAQAEFDVQ
ncbi:MAG: hypothetical protein IJA81_07050 [Akkermansia sp.]|nr:hypothetical protein [Akkermansia sp.]